VNETRARDQGGAVEFLQQLEKRLVDKRLLRNVEKRPSMVRNIRNRSSARACPPGKCLPPRIVSDLSALRERRNESRTWHGTP